MTTINELFGINSTRPFFQKDADILRVPDEEFNAPDYKRNYVPVIDPNYNFREENVRIMNIAFASNVPTYLYGHAGVGKTSLIEQYCARTRRPFLRVQHTANVEEAHIVGQWTVREENGNAVTKFELGPLPYAMKYGLVYCADEYDFGQPAILATYQAVLEGKSLVIKEADEENRVIIPHKNFRFFATGNTNGTGDSSGAYQGTVIQNAANYERFGITKKIDYMTEKEERQILLCKTKIASLAGDENKEARESTVDSILKFANQMRSKFESGDISIAPSIRVLINIINIGWSLGDLKLGVEYAYANRLRPGEEKEAAMVVANQYISDLNTGGK